jgi:hypothetical protein
LNEFFIVLFYQFSKFAENKKTKQKNEEKEEKKMKKDFVIRILSFLSQEKCFLPALFLEQFIKVSVERIPWL